MTSVAMPYARGSLISMPIINYSRFTDHANARRPLSFHAVSFGQDASSSSLRRMTEIALEVQNNAPHDPLLPAAANVPSSYTEALDTVSWPKTLS